MRKKKYKNRLPYFRRPIEYRCIGGARCRLLDYGCKHYDAITASVPPWETTCDARSVPAFAKSDPSQRFELAWCAERGHPRWRMLRKATILCYDGLLER